MRQEHFQITSGLEGINQVQGWFRTVCHTLDGDFAWVSDYTDRLSLALTEGFTNAVRHAHAEMPSDTAICIDLALTKDHVEIRIWDQGGPFDPEQLPEPKPGELLEKGGYGWFLLRRLADRVTYQRFQDGRNCLSIVQYGT
jgi:serine/threonine-protein kinase RsbW